MINKSKVLIAFLLIIFVITDVLIFVHFYDKESLNESMKQTYNAALEEYNEASPAYNIEGLESAEKKFAAIPGYKDADSYPPRIDDEIRKINQYNAGVEAYKNNAYSDAYSAFENIRGYRDVETYLKKMSDYILEQSDYYIDTEQYDAAMDILLFIPEYMEPYYSDACQKYNSIEGIKAEKEKSRKYELAVSNYNDGDYVMAQTGFMELKGYKDSQDYLEKIGDTLYKKAKDLYGQKAYAQAIECLEPIMNEGTWSNSDSAVSLKNEIRNACVENALSRADEEYHSSYEIDKAIEILTECKNEMGGDARIDSAINDYKNNTMVYIADMDLLNYSYNDDLDGRLNTNEYLTSNYGVTYKNSVNCGGGWISYMVGGRGFTRFKGTVACPQDAINSDGYRESAFINIYGKVGDEKAQLLYTTKEFKNSTQPEDVSVDITGYDVIYFEWECIGSNIWHDWGEFATIFEGRFMK